MKGPCSSCTFSSRQPRQDGQLGLECRNEPPRVILVPVMTPQGPQMGIQSAWPGVPENGNCGKFEQDPMLGRTKQ